MSRVLRQDAIDLHEKASQDDFETFLRNELASFFKAFDALLGVDVITNQ